MSRVGKVPVGIPEKVEVKITNNKVTIKGPKGSMEKQFSDCVTIEVKDKQLTVKLKDPQNLGGVNKAIWGTTRALIKNMLTGVTDGFTKSLEFNGVGYKAAVAGNKLTLNLGHSHAIDYDLPAGIKAQVTKNVIDIIGADREMVGQVAAIVRAFRPCEPYK
ncbi:MAG: 50S ribosomal protein L6, partial [Pseudomonadota bacterium]